jgi:hypothetical protein
MSYLLAGSISDPNVPFEPYIRNLGVRVAVAACVSITISSQSIQQCYSLRFLSRTSYLYQPNEDTNIAKHHLAKRNGGRMPPYRFLAPLGENVHVYRSEADAPTSNEVYSNNECGTH